MESHCLICGSISQPYFKKHFDQTKFYDQLSMEYRKCSHCGFVHSETLQRMEKSKWVSLNKTCHVAFEEQLELRIVNQPPYAEMGMILKILIENGLIRSDRILDYAAGYGTLAQVLGSYFDVQIDCYDPYVTNEAAPNSVKYVSNVEAGSSTCVINSAMFEHVLTRHDLDVVNNCVSDDGVFMLHTLICENVPADPNWFYLAPIVHSAFHTNKSMEILMGQWGYSDALYSPAAKSWFLFKQDSPQTQRLSENIQKINDEFQCELLFHKKGFVDYWKGF
jgi:hypothetical protein